MFNNLPMVKRGKESTVGVPIIKWSFITKAYDCD